MIAGKNLIVVDQNSQWVAAIIADVVAQLANAIASTSFARLLICFLSGLATVFFAEPLAFVELAVAARLLLESGYRASWPRFSSELSPRTAP